LKTVKYWVEKGADVNVKTDEGETPLFIAAEKNSLEVVKYLVEKGADINVKTNDGKTSLDVADSEEVKKILSEAGGKSGEEIK
jgi:ankyrin repeat protein